MPANQAFVQEYVLTFPQLYVNGLHRTSTLRRAVTRHHIDMFTPEASRTMIGVALSKDTTPAALTSKIFSSSLKFFCHDHILIVANAI